MSIFTLEQIEAGTERTHEAGQDCVSRDNWRRNCLTETTRTRFRRAILIKSRSRFRSSSRVTRYCDLPTMAASRIASSSGSRQIFSSPDTCTTVARAAINRTNISVSRCEYRNRWTNLGLVRTSAISLSCESDVTALNSSRAQAVMTSPGGPLGLRKAEIQTLVSSRATSGTAFGFDFGSCSSHFRLNNVLRNPFRTSLHSAKQTSKFLPPLSLRVKGDQNAGMLLQLKGPERSKQAIFVYCFNRFLGRVNFSWQWHKTNYTDRSYLEQVVA